MPARFDARPVSRHVYVYYRIAGDTPAARAAVSALLAAVERTTGVLGRLLARCDDPRTWMEVYEPVPEGRAFLDALEALAHEHRVDAFAVDGVRHTECFAAPSPAPASADCDH